MTIKNAVRWIRSHPAFTAVSVLTLTLGIGANAAVFSVATSVFLPQQSVSDPDRLAKVGWSSIYRPTEVLGLSYPEYDDLRTDYSHIFQNALAFVPFRQPIVVQGNARVALGEMVDDSYFHVLGLRPHVGRFISKDDISSESRVAVVSHNLWRRHFQDENAIGSEIVVGGEMFTIIGIAPRGFAGLVVPELVQEDVWIPLSLFRRIEQEPNAVQALEYRQQYLSGFFTDRSLRIFEVRARLHDTVSIDQAEAAISTVAQAFKQAEPRHLHNRELRLVSGSIGSTDIRRVARPAFGAIASLSLLVLIAACANLAGLLVARTIDRMPELALRLALGARRHQIVTQLFVENLLITTLAAAASVAVAALVATPLSSLNPPPIAGVTLRLQSTIDWGMLGFAIAVTIVVAFLVSGPPAVTVSKARLAGLFVGNMIVDTKRRSLYSAQNLLVGLQFAVSACLVALALQFLLISATPTVAPPPDAEGIAMAELELGLHQMQSAPAVAFGQRLLLRATEGQLFDRAALSTAIPGSGRPKRTVKRSADVAGPEAQIVRVTPDFLDLWQLRILYGRGLHGTDELHQPVAVISESLAKDLGQPADLVGTDIDVVSDNTRSFRVLGVVSDATTNLSTARAVYTLLSQNPSSQLFLYANSKRMGAAPIRELREVIRLENPEVAVSQLRSVADYIADLNYPFWVSTVTIAGLASLAVTLACLGLHGIMEYLVSRQVREFGVHMALGADRPRIVQLALLQALRPVALGVLAGVVFGYFALKLTEHLTGGAVDATLAPLAVVPALLAVVSCMACLRPALRASRLDPMVALREL